MEDAIRPGSPCAEQAFEWGECQILSDAPRQRENSRVRDPFSTDLAIIRGRLQSQVQGMAPGDAAVGAEMHAAIDLMVGFEGSQQTKRTNDGEGSSTGCVTKFEWKRWSARGRGSYGSGSWDKGLDPSPRGFSAIRESAGSDPQADEARGRPGRLAYTERNRQGDGVRGGFDFGTVAASAQKRARRIPRREAPQAAVVLARRNDTPTKPR